MDLLQKLEERIAPRLMEIVKIAGASASAKGQSLYLVGGAVRDLLLDRANIDLDLVVEGNALELAGDLSVRLGSKLVSHDRFGTAKLICGAFTLDLVTARSETYERPGALPSVKPGSLREDLARRDFSINAMALGLSPPHTGELIDPFGGKADLGSRLMRVLHEQSFVDDATRLLRAVRYERRLNFRLEPGTEELARRDVAYLDTISGDRLRHELELIFGEREPEVILARADALGILGKILPGLCGKERLKQSFPRAREMFQPKQPPMGVYLSLVAWDLGLEEIERLTTRLNLPGRLARVMRDSARLRKRLPAFRPGMKRSEIYEMLSRVLPYAIQTNIIAGEHPAASAAMELYLNELRWTKAETEGARLRALGAPPGPGIGRILHAIRMARLDGLVRDRGEEEALAVELIEKESRMQNSESRRAHPTRGLPPSRE